MAFVAGVADTGAVGSAEGKSVGSAVGVAAGVAVGADAVLQPLKTATNNKLQSKYMMNLVFMENSSVNQTMQRAGSLHR